MCPSLQGHVRVVGQRGSARPGKGRSTTRLEARRWHAHVQSLARARLSDRSGAGSLVASRGCEQAQLAPKSAEAELPQAGTRHFARYLLLYVSLVPICRYINLITCISLTCSEFLDPSLPSRDITSRGIDLTRYKYRKMKMEYLVIYDIFVTYSFTDYIVTCVLFRAISNYVADLRDRRVILIPFFYRRFGEQRASSNQLAGHHAAVQNLQQAPTSGEISPRTSYAVIFLHLLHIHANPERTSHRA